jgi:hypothetical protein
VGVVTLSKAKRLSIDRDFHETDRCGETHGGCDRRLVMAEMVLVAMKKMWHGFFLVCRVLSDLQ